MRNLLLIFFFLLSSFSLAKADEGLCIKTFQGGQEVTTVCFGQVVTFSNCTEPTPSSATVFFYPGKLDASYDESKKINEGQEYRFTSTGEQIITLVINDPQNSDEYGSDTRTKEFVFDVKSTEPPTFTATACADRKVSVSLTDPIYDNFIIDYGDGTRRPVKKGETPVVYTYTTPGPYQIRVTGSYEGATCTSASPPKTVNELQPYTMPALSKLEVIEQDASAGSIRFTFTTLTAGYFYTLKRESGNSTTSVATLSSGQTSYTLQNASTLEKALYRIDATDACGTTLQASNAVGNIVLHVTTADEKNTIEWQSLQPATRSELYRNNELIQVSNLKSPYTDQGVTYGQEYCYSVLHDEGAVSVSARQCIVVIDEQDAQLHIPSAFTPNGDELNDLFEVKGRYIKDYTIRIYNGAGQVIYTSSNREESWDGTFKGSPLPAGAYAYEVIATSANNKIKRRTGTVTLLR